MKALILFTSALLLFFACKVADAGATTDDSTDGAGGGTSTTYTVTIDPNDGKPGTVPNRIVSPGGTAPALTGNELPSKTDSEIAYWSTEPNNYDKHFVFDSTPVNGNITVYPHFRYTLAKVKSLISGNWYYYDKNSVGVANYTVEKMYKFNADASLYSVCKKPDFPNPDINLLDPANSLILNKLTSMPPEVHTRGSPVNINGVDYDITGTTNYIVKLYTDKADTNAAYCNYSDSLTNSFASYADLKTTNITMNTFMGLKADQTSTGTLSFVSDDEFNYIYTSTLAVQAGTYLFKRVK